MNRAVLVILLVAVGSAACGQDAPAPPAPATSATASPAQTNSATITVTSSAFAAGAPIPEQYSCHGANTSPPLRWSGVPSGAAALALVVDDPDAPGGTYRHWIVVNIPPTVSEVAAGAVPAGGWQLPNSNSNAAYDGPCPPSDTHHYRFTVYALRQALTLAPGTRLTQALAAIDAATLASGQLVGTFAA